MVKISKILAVAAYLLTRISWPFVPSHPVFLNCHLKSICILQNLLLNLLHLLPTPPIFFHLILFNSATSLLRKHRGRNFSFDPETSPIRRLVRLKELVQQRQMISSYHPTVRLLSFHSLVSRLPSRPNEQFLMQEGKIY